MFDEVKRNLRQAYNRKVGERDSMTPQSWKQEVRAGFLSLLQQEQKRTLLEIGLGAGKDSLYFQEHGLNVTGIDLSPEMVSLCRGKGLAAYEMDVCSLRFPPASFDAVYSLNCLLHLPKAELPHALDEIDAVLKPDGLFYLGVYGGYDHEGIWMEDTYEPKRFFSFYRDEAMEEILGRVFDVISFRPIAVTRKGDGLHFQSWTLRKKEQG